MGVAVCDTVYQLEAVYSTFCRSQWITKISNSAFPVNIQKRAIIDPQVKHNYNGVLLAGRWWPDTAYWLGCGKIKSLMRVLPFCSFYQEWRHFSSHMNKNVFFFLLLVFKSLFNDPLANPNVHFYATVYVSASANLEPFSGS